MEHKERYNTESIISNDLNYKTKQYSQGVFLFLLCFPDNRLLKPEQCYKKKQLFARV